MHKAGATSGRAGGDDTDRQIYGGQVHGTIAQVRAAPGLAGQPSAERAGVRIHYVGSKAGTRTQGGIANKHGPPQTVIDQPKVRE